MVVEVVSHSSAFPASRSLRSSAAFAARPFRVQPDRQLLAMQSSLSSLFSISRDTAIPTPPVFPVSSFLAKTNSNWPPSRNETVPATTTSRVFPQRNVRRPAPPQGPQSASSSASSSSAAASRTDPSRPTASSVLSPPFPNGLCGGQLVTLPPSETFAAMHAQRHPFGLSPPPPRPISVWLPPGYDSASGSSYQRYPVLYCHDGQNMMQDETSWTGHSWRLAGALTRLYEHGLIPQLPIVVLLPSADYEQEPEQNNNGNDANDISSQRQSNGNRISSFPWSLPRFLATQRHLEYGDALLPFAMAHADFVALTLKTVIDTHFRTYTAADHTVTMGSSLGGQASLHLLVRHAHTFGGAACLSPAIGPTLMRHLQDPRVARILRHGQKRLYLDMGGTVDDQDVPWLDVLDHMTPKHWWNPGYFWLDTHLQAGVQEVCHILQRQQIPFVYHDVPGGRHNERAWSKRVHHPLQHLLSG